MKMTQAHYEALKAKVMPLVPSIPAYRESLKTDPKVKNLDQRVLWDVFHAAKIWKDYSYQEFDYLDAHIETAMRAIFKELDVPTATQEADTKPATNKLEGAPPQVPGGYSQGK